MRRALSATLVAAVLVLAGCGGGSEDATSSADGALSGEVVVFAAASLTEAFTQLGEDFEADHPDVTVTLSFGSSATLATQLVEGAPVDVFAAASPATMTTVTDAGLVDGEPTVFARNSLQIVVPPGNPAGVTGLADFAKPELRLVVCAEQVPCGAAATTAFGAAGVTPQIDSFGTDVKATLSTVTLGEADAALVYRTDVTAAGDGVEGVDIPEASAAINDYPIAALGEAPNAEAAAAFVEFVLSDEGTAELTDRGFQLP